MQGARGCWSRNFPVSHVKQTQIHTGFLSSLVLIQWVSPSFVFDTGTPLASYLDSRSLKMHRALLIQEVVQLIIQHIRVALDLGFNHGQRQTLYSVALTCSSFLEVALDALWYNMDSLAPLFKLSNSEEKVCHFFCVSQFLIIVQQHAMLESDLQIFDAYASRVRRFRCHCREDDINISAYVRVLRVARRSCIFPKLLRLVVCETYRDGANTAKIESLISPCLREFRMFGSSRSTVIILNSLQITTSDISCLTLGGMAFDDHYVSVICLLSQLRELSILKDNRFEAKSRRDDSSTFDLSFFPRLSCKNSLRRFKLDWPYIDWLDVSSDSGTVEFPSLEFIDFAIIGPIAEFFRYVMVPGLKGLSIEFGLSPSKLDKFTEAQCRYHFFDLIKMLDHLKILEIVRNCSAGTVHGHGSGFPYFGNPTSVTFSIKSPFLRSGQPHSLDWSCECPPLVHTVARLSFVNTFVPWFALQPNVGSYSATLTRILSGEFWSTNNFDNEILYRYWSGKAKLRIQSIHSLSPNIVW